MSYHLPLCACVCGERNKLKPDARLHWPFFVRRTKRDKSRFGRTFKLGPLSSSAAEHDKHGGKWPKRAGHSIFCPASWSSPVYKISPAYLPLTNNNKCICTYMGVVRIFWLHSSACIVFAVTQRCGGVFSNGVPPSVRPMYY